MNGLRWRLKSFFDKDRDPHLKMLLKFCLLVILVTLFARTMAGSADARVTVIMPENKTLKKEVHTAGTLNPVGSETYEIPDGLLVTEVTVKIGDPVSRGDVLARLDAPTLDELLIRGEGQLRQMQLQHEALLDVRDPSYDSVKQAKKSLASAKDSRDALALSLTEAENTLAQARERLESAPETELAAVREEVTQAEKAVSGLTAQLNGANDAVSDAQDSLARAQEDYSEALSQTQRQRESNQASADILMLDIEKAAAAVAGLQAVRDDGYAVLSQTNGILASVNLIPGTKTQDSTYAVSNPYAGQELTFRIPSGDILQQTLLDRVTISRDEASMNLYNVVRNGDSEGTEQVTFSARITDEEWDTGPVLVNATLWEERYDTCVPVSALRQDGKGYFVYVVSRETDIWAVTQTVCRVDVQVVRLDDAYAAVMGNLGSDSQVILSSSKPLYEGSRIRVVP